MKARISGLYAVTPDLVDTTLLLEQLRAAISGGVRLVQYRNKVADENLLREQATALRDLCRSCGATLIINDHVELAREIDADGVHIGAEDAAIAHARSRLGVRKIIGASCYDELPRAKIAVPQGVDYVAFGSFFPSTIKPGAVRASLALLQQARREFMLPIVAIGGITQTNARELISAGADAIAVISALFFAPDIEVAAREFGGFFRTKDA